MKLSETTITVLKNFAQINPTLLIIPGNKITTMAPSESVLVTADFGGELDIPSRGAIFDLNRFIATLSLFEDPDVDFTDTYVNVSKGKKAVKYTFAAENMIIVPKDASKLKFPEISVELNLTWDELTAALRASAILGSPEIAIRGRDGEIFIVAQDSANPSADTYESPIGVTDKEFTFIFKKDNLKLLNLDYAVKITSKGIADFVSTNTEGPKMQYYVAVEANSSITE
tara:strand:- start:1126 stop:1809 length:684 start_codon:yes stop_codon:yes gene_type:complete